MYFDQISGRLVTHLGICEPEWVAGMTVHASDHCLKCDHSAAFHGGGGCISRGCDCKETRDSIRRLQRDAAKTRAMEPELCANPECRHERGHHWDDVCHVERCACAHFVRPHAELQSGDK